MIYLDHNATAPLLPEAQAAMAAAMAVVGNPHFACRLAQQVAAAGAAHAGHQAATPQLREQLFQI